MDCHLFVSDRRKVKTRSMSGAQFKLAIWIWSGCLKSDIDPSCVGKVQANKFNRYLTDGNQSINKCNSSSWSVDRGPGGESKDMV